MLLIQNKDTFIRFYEDIGYIKNQRLNLDLVYNKTGKYYLSQISRQPQEFDEVVNRLENMFFGATKEMIEKDFRNFSSYLDSCGFITIGKDENELLAKESELEETYTNQTNYPIIEEDLGIVHSSALLFKLFKKSPHIFDLQIELTKNCNERCIHCYLPMKDRISATGSYLNTEEVKDVLDQAAEMGVLGVTFSGGELLLRNDLMEILWYARKKDFIINLFSNAVLVTDEIASELKKINVNDVQVSLYSMDKDTHEAVTMAKGSYEKTLRGIDLLLKHGVNVILSCPIMKINRRSFRDVQAYADTKKIKAGGDYMLIGQGDLDTRNLSQRISLKEAEEFLMDMIQNNSDYKKSLRSKVDNYDYREREVEDKISCGVGIDTINITSTGDIIPCPGWYGYSLGNIRNDKLKDVWLHSEKLEYLRNIRLSQFPKCVSCEARPYCNMCILRNFNENNGDMFKIPKHTCQIAFLRKKLVENML